MVLSYYLSVSVLQVEGEISEMEMAAKYTERAAERVARRRLRKAGQMREPTSDEVHKELPTAPEMSELLIGKHQWWAALCDCTSRRRGEDSGGAPQEGREECRDTSACSASLRQGSREGLNVGSGCSRGRTRGGRQILARSNRGPAVPKSTGVHVLR